MRISWIAGLVALGTVGAIAPAAAEGCGPLQIFASLDATESKNGAILVSLGIDDTKGYFKLDFGQPVSGITGQVSDLLQKKRTEVDQNITINIARQSVKEMVNVKLTFGATSGTDWLGVIPEPIRGDQTISGTIGYDILRHFDVELDLAHNKVNLFSQDHCPGKVVYWTHTATVAAIPFITRKSQAFLVPMQLDGKDVEVQIATDEDHDYLNARIAQLNFGISPAPDGPGNSGPKPLPFKTLSVDGLTINNPVVYPYGHVTAEACNGGERYHPEGLRNETHQFVETCFGQPDLFLGRSTLRQLRVFLAFSEKMLYATPADAQ
jgi:hypothetical protein